MTPWGVRCYRFLPLAAVLAAACAAAPTPVAAPAPAPAPALAPRSVTPTPTTGTHVPAPAHRAARPTASPSPVPEVWKVGASPLPLAAGGFGQVLPTPRVLRDRRLQAADVLPAPADGRFHATVGPVTAALRDRMGKTYAGGCPVGLDRLRYLTVTFRGFDGRPHTGEIVVAGQVAEPVVGIFRDLFARGFPIEAMRLPTTADIVARPTGDGNDTAGFVCRAARGQRRYSAHAYGLAIDVNPFQNPEKRGRLVLPELASAYTDRGWVRPGMFTPGSSAVRAFTSRGWTWGGSFHSLKDYMHFSQTGT